MNSTIEIRSDTITTGAGMTKTVYVAYDRKYYGCMAQGNTMEEALTELDIAREGYIETLKELGRWPEGDGDRP